MRLNVLNEFPNDFCRVHFAYIGCIYVEYHAVIKVIHACMLLFLAKKALSQAAFVADITSNSLATISDKVLWEF